MTDSIDTSSIVLRSRVEHSPVVKIAMVDALYAPMATLSIGTLCGVIGAAIIAVVSGVPALWWFLVIMAAVGISRIGLVIGYRAKRPSLLPSTIAFWEKMFVASSWALSAIMGTSSAVAIMQSQDHRGHLVIIAIAVAFGLGVSGRNLSRPWLVIGQIALVMFPVMGGLMLIGNVFYAALAGAMWIALCGFTNISLAVRRGFDKALEAGGHSALAASRYATSNELFDKALSAMSHGLCLFDRDHGLVLWNDKFCSLMGVSDCDLWIGCAITDVVGAASSSGAVSASDISLLVQCYESMFVGGGERSVVIVLDNETSLELSFRRTDDGGSVVLTEDVTERTAAENQIHRMAHYDGLTGLPNRMSFTAECAVAIKRIKAIGGQSAVLTIDLDHFKQVNDTLGHPIGDRLLVAVSDQLKCIVGPGSMVARFGGDEFVILQNAITGPEDAGNLASEIISSLTHTYDIDGHQVIIGATIGIALAIQDGDSVDMLIKNSDLALYRAKSSGRGHSCFFQREMDERAQNRRLLELDLRAAVEAGDFSLHYQPIVDLKRGRIASCEALIRWSHPERGSISPVDFIPIAEESGMIVSIGEWVLRQACREASTWPEGVSVAVNLSPIQFRFRGLVESVRSALADSGLPPSRLELEITENVLMQDTDATRAVINELVSMGVSLSLDDFGTGYSSISYLRSYPFKKLKIDRSFVNGVESDEVAREMVRAISIMARALGLTIVAEGIEDPQQIAVLASEGCDMGQGYFFGRPAPAANLRFDTDVMKAA